MRETNSIPTTVITVKKGSGHCSGKLKYFISVYIIIYFIKQRGKSVDSVRDALHPIVASAYTAKICDVLVGLAAKKKDVRRGNAQET